MDTSGALNVLRMPTMQQFAVANSKGSNNNINNNNSKIRGNSNHYHVNGNQNNLHKFDVPAKEEASLLPAAAAATTATPPTTIGSSNSSGNTSGVVATTPPDFDFDFNLPCRYFKSSFARSLSLSNHNQCKSLDFDVNHYRGLNNSNNNSGNNNNNNSNHHYNNNSGNNINVAHLNNGIGGLAAKIDGPPLPQRMVRTTTLEASSAAPTAATATGTTTPTITTVEQNEVSSVICSDAKPPAIPARRSPPSSVIEMQQAVGNMMQKQQQQQLQQQQQPVAQLRNSLATANAAAGNSGSAHGNYHKINMQQQFYNKNPHINNNSRNKGVDSNTHSVCNSSNNNNSSNNTRRNLWPKDNTEQDGNQCYNDADDRVEQGEEIVEEQAVKLAAISITKAEAVQPPMDQPQQQRAPAAAFELHDNTVNVEVVLLQNQVDTLQWQLKQVETSCDMYRAVMEEVSRFFDRYQLQKLQQRQQQQQQARNSHLGEGASTGSQEQIARSKSLYHVNSGVQEKSHTLDAVARDSSGYLRTRSSTNLIEQAPPGGKYVTKLSNVSACTDDPDYGRMSPAQSYSAFNDFTWRRSPRKYCGDRKSKANTVDIDEKLNQEAFRLSRTIHNLLHTSTRQPDLTQHRNSLAAVSLGRLCKAPSSSLMSLHAPMLNSTALSLAAHGNAVGATPNPIESVGNPLATAAKSSALATEMLFLRSTNMRDSRISLRSSTDSSVHSTTSSAASCSSSSKERETDEESNTPFHTSASSNSTSTCKQLQQPHGGSTTEDESGFSSISSFHDVGLPHCSTPLKSRLPKECVANESNTICDFNPDSRNSTLKAAPSATHPNNVVGLPIQPAQDLHQANTHHHNIQQQQQQQRWDSASKTYRNANKFQRFSTLTNEDSAAVLWV